MGNSSDSFLHGKTVPKEQVEVGITRQILGHDDAILMARVEFEAGAIGYVHHHIHSQTTYIESGEFEVTVGDTSELMRGGDAFYIPPNVPHGAVCRKAGVLLDVFSPTREDFFQPDNES